MIIVPSSNSTVSPWLVVCPVKRPTPRYQSDFMNCQT